MSYRGEQPIKGTIYIYEATATWNPKKKRSEQKRTYIGKKDPVTGALIPNERYKNAHPDEFPMDKPATIPVQRSVDFGNIYLMKQLAESTGLKQVIQECFPDCWQELLVCAMHLCSENEPLYLCQQWAEDSAVPIAPSSQKLSKLLVFLNEERRMCFYQAWAKLRAEREYLALDITSVSSWSELIQYVERGYNRDHEKLPQINLGMLFGEQSRLPVFCRTYPGSIKDVSTLVGMSTFTDHLSLKLLHLVMDRGYYSLKGITPLLKNYIKFSIGVPFTTNLAKEAVTQVQETISSPRNAIEVDGHIYYAQTLVRTINDRRVYLHVYFDEERHARERTVLVQKIIQLETELTDGSMKRMAPAAKKYFSFHKRKDGGYNIHRNEEVIEQERSLSGYFEIMSNDSKDAKYVLEVYRTKDVVEKSFDNLKNDLDLERLRVHSDDAMEGRIFIGFVSLILISSIREQMRQAGLYQSFSFNTLMKELKKLKLVEFKNGDKLLTEITAKQKKIYKDFGLRAPEASSI